MTRLGVAVITVALAAFLVRYEHRQSSNGELWIVTLPAGYELSVQRNTDESWAAYWFNDRGMERLLFVRSGRRHDQPGPRPSWSQL